MYSLELLLTITVPLSCCVHSCLGCTYSCRDFRDGFLSLVSGQVLVQGAAPLLEAGTCSNELMACRMSGMPLALLLHLCTRDGVTSVDKQTAVSSALTRAQKQDMHRIEAEACMTRSCRSLQKDEHTAYVESRLQAYTIHMLLTAHTA